MRGYSGRHSGSRAGSRHRRQVGILILALASVSLLLSLFVGRGLTIRKLQREVAALNAECSTALDDQAALLEALDRAGDSSVIEEIARRELGLVFPGEEKVYFLEDESP